MVEWASGGGAASLVNVSVVSSSSAVFASSWTLWIAMICFHRCRICKHGRGCLQRHANLFDAQFHLDSPDAAALIWDGSMTALLVRRLPCSCICFVLFLWRNFKPTVLKTSARLYSLLMFSLVRTSSDVARGISFRSSRGQVCRRQNH